MTSNCNLSYEDRKNIELYINHFNILDFSKPSFYNYVNNGVFELKPLDFHRIVKYKKYQLFKKLIFIY